MALNSLLCADVPLRNHSFIAVLSVTFTLRHFVHSFIIDDGSSTAFVSCTGHQVANLLDLNATQWAAIESIVRPINQVIYQLVRPVNNSVSVDISSATSDRSELFKRVCIAFFQIIVLWK
jgi:hypothetical protein